MVSTRQEMRARDSKHRASLARRLASLQPVKPFVQFAWDVSACAAAAAAGYLDSCRPVGVVCVRRVTIMMWTSCDLIKVAVETNATGYHGLVHEYARPLQVPILIGSIMCPFVRMPSTTPGVSHL